MNQNPSQCGDSELQALIDRGLNGDSTANEALITHARDRLFRLTRQMFHTQGASLRRWEQTDDLFQNSMIRLHSALSLKPVESVRHFFNLAAMLVRLELIDLARHHYGDYGLARKHHTDHQPSDDQGGTLYTNVTQPDDLAQWSEFHARVEALPEDAREVVNLLYYEGLTQAEAARLLGVSVSTIKRRWQEARLKISEAFASEPER